MNLWEFVTMFGDFQFWVAASMTALLIYLGVPNRLRKYLVWFIFLVLPSVVMSYSVTGTLKLIFKIPRPCFGLEWCPKTYSFPSGHATVAFAALTIIALHYKNEKLGFVLLLFACLVAYSRVALNVHRPEDVIVGSLIGLLTSFLVWRAYEKQKRDIEALVTK